MASTQQLQQKLASVMGKRVATGGQPAYIKIDDGTPTAAATDPLMPANWVDYFTVNRRSTISRGAG